MCELLLWTDMTNNTATSNHFNSNDSADGTQRPRLNRSRWAAFGAAVAVSLGAGGFGLASASVSTGEQPVYIAIDPCRLTDTRPEFLVGPRATPYGPNETVTWTGTGAQGNCNVPAGVSSLVLNVTAIGATLPTYLQFAPGTTVTPGGASSLNPVPDQPPTPNAVTTPIDDDGKFSVYNLQGTVHVIIDVVGYHDDHEHTGDDIVDNSLTRVDIADEGGVAYATAPNPNAISGNEQLIAVDLRAPSTGHVVVTANALFDFTSPGIDQVSCVITDGSTHLSSSLEGIVTEPAPAYAQSMEITRSFPVSAAGEVTYRFLCQSVAGSAAVSQVHITAAYAPTWYGDITLGPIVPIGPIGPIVINP